MTDQINNDSAVLVDFTLKLADGSTAESTYDQGKPALFRLGDGSLSASLEQQLIGLRIGDKSAFTLPPEAAFGNSEPDLIQYFSQGDFAHTGVPEVGTIMLFTGMDGREMPGIVREVASNSITVDFNHPLAGQAISFDMVILAIDPPQETTDAHITG